MGRERPLGAVAAGIVIFIAGLIVGVWALEQARSEADRLSVAAHADGTVTGHLNGRPVVAFTLPGGDRITFTATNVGRDDHAVGTHVDVFYRPDQPSDAIVDRPRARWARTGLLGVLAIAVMGFGAYLSWYARNRDLRRA